MEEIIELPPTRPLLLKPKQFNPWLRLSLALLCLSITPIFIRLSETDLGAQGTVFNRLLIFALVFGTGRALSQRLTPTASVSEELDRQPPLTWRQWFLFLALGLSSIATLGLFALALEYTSLAKSIFLNNLTPVFTSLIAWLGLGQRFDEKFWLGMSLALTGAVALGLEDLEGSESHLVGDIYALLSAVFLGIYFLIVEQLRHRFSATTILLWRCTLGSLLLLPIVLLTEGQLFPTSLLCWLGVLGLGLISEGLGQRLIAECLEQLSSSLIALFLLLEPILSAILAWLIWAESLSSTTWVGFAVILTGIYLAQSGSAAIHLHPHT